MFADAALTQIPQRAPVIRFAAAACRVLFIGAAALSLYGVTSIQSHSGSTFHMLVAAFSIYLLVECLRHLRRCDTLGLLAPPFLASLLHFYMAYVMPSTGTLIDPWIIDRFAEYFTSQPDQLSEAVLVISLAAFCMWRGYTLGLPAAHRLRKRLQKGKLFRRNLEPALIPVLGLQVVYFAVVGYAIAQGVFGMVGSGEQREGNIELLDLINIGLAGGSLSLFLLLTYTFRRRAAGRSEVALSIACGILICLHLIVGAISGFKSQLVMPFVMLTFARFIATRQISLGFIAAACVALVVAYQVIEPYRAYLARNQLQGAADAGSLVDALQKSYEQKDLIYKNDIPLGSQIVSRLDLTGMSAVGIAFATDNAVVRAKSEEFAESLYLSPILAWVPRVLWPGKPSYASGVWFNHIVLGRIEDTTTSVGMGPVTWLYVMGGSLGVALGFFGLGLLQAIMFEGVGRSGAGGFIVYLSALLFLSQIPSDFGPALTGMLRLLPIAFVAQYVLLRPDANIRLRTREL